MKFILSLTIILAISFNLITSSNLKKVNKKDDKTPNKVTTNL